MPWPEGQYPPSYENQPARVRNKAVEIANAMLASGAPEGLAIATGLKNARKLTRKKMMEEKLRGVAKRKAPERR